MGLQGLNGLLFILVLLKSGHASWWYLGLLSTSDMDLVSETQFEASPARCAEVSVLAPHQQSICTRSAAILDIVGRGAAMGIEECQHQFKHRRWNCTTFNNTSVFGKVLRLRSREQAYIYAVSSAGVMHALTKSCAKGRMSECGCDSEVRTRETEDRFMWGGCSHNVEFGDTFTKEFLDKGENPHQDTGLMNLWNNNAGRRAISDNMKLLCKCHGVSGSCSAKICWRTMPNFRDVGTKLRERFDGASHVKMARRKRKLRPISKKLKRPTKKDLVYLQTSPDFCESNPRLGSLGTQGRACNATSYGLDGCMLMCCGRGHYTMVAELEEDCDCKFFWCCRVECSKCKKKVELHYCN